MMNTERRKERRSSIRKGITVMNTDPKKFIKVIGVVIVFLIGIFIIRWLLIFRIVFAAIFAFWNPTNTFIDYINTTKITNKEELFQFVIDNQEELDQVVYEMISHYGASDDRVTILYKYDHVLSSLDNVNELFNEVSAVRIAIDNMKEVKQVDILFDYVPDGFDYWGIYYSKTGGPADWGGERELLEQDGMYVQLGSYFKYETEKIFGNWYYYQCDTR